MTFWSPCRLVLVGVLNQNKQNLYLKNTEVEARLDTMDEAEEAEDGVTEAVVDLSDLSTDIDFSGRSEAVLADILSSEDLKIVLLQTRKKIMCAQQFNLMDVSVIVNQPDKKFIRREKVGNILYDIWINCMKNEKNLRRNTNIKYKRYKKLRYISWWVPTRRTKSARTIKI